MMICHGRKDQKISKITQPNKHKVTTWMSQEVNGSMVIGSVGYFTYKKKWGIPWGPK